MHLDYSFMEMQNVITIGQQSVSAWQFILQE
jgi:hypothetical protein